MNQVIRTIQLKMVATLNSVFAHDTVSHSSNALISKFVSCLIFILS